MNVLTIARRSVFHYWRTNLAVALGVAAAVAVLAGALLVGDSVRGSLRDIALARLGRTDEVVASTGFFARDLADRVNAVPSVTGAAPLVVANGFATNPSSARRAGSVLVYGVDESFWRFHGLEPRDGVYASPALAEEVEAGEGDVLLIRLQRPSEIPIESLFGRKDETGRTLRLTLAGVLPREQLGEFALQPRQGTIRALFAPLGRIQRDLGVGQQVNTVIAAGSIGEDDLRRALRLDDLGVRVTTPVEGTIAVESASGVVNHALEQAAREAGAALGLEPMPVFTYLANTLRVRDREVPYSLIAATDLDVLAPLTRAEPRATDNELRTASGDSIVLNEWTARDLGASIGAPLEIEYYLWDPAAGLLTRSASFTVAGIVPIAGLAADRRLAPEYPGITDSNSLADWDPPFPVDLSRVRDVDEQYWDEFRTTPKAFIEYERGRELWETRYGALTSLRFRVPPGADAEETAAALGRALLSSLSPQALGVAAYPARQLALEASTGATDFGEYFTYFSFFLVVTALMLAVLFFRLGIEGRLKQIGILRAGGYTSRVVRRLFLTEAVLLAVMGAAIGAAGAVGYAHLIVYGLRTWWIGAVGTQLLEVHVTGRSLAFGAIGGVLAAIVCVIVSVRAVAKVAPRALLTAQSLEAARVDPRRAKRRRRLAFALVLIAALAVAAGIFTGYQAAAFFTAGASLLVASLLLLAAWLRGRDRRPIAGRGGWAVARLGFRNAAFRPARSVLSAALIAAATFIIVSVDAFRKGGGDFAAGEHSGTGGYALIARAELPVVHNPNDERGREELLIDQELLGGARFTRFRVRPGQDASCLNLYRPTTPTLIAPEAGFIERNRFAFAASLAESDEERANPWLILRRNFEDGSVPVIADATSLQYVLHASVGDTFSMDVGNEAPLVLRFVGALRDSVLQGELIMAEEQFTRLFPGQQGYRMFLIEDPAVRTLDQARNLAAVVEEAFEPFGLDAVTTVERLEEFHRVENTYLSTFQALGGLGLLLGTIGLAAVMFRNVLERRRELALLRAVGYDARHVSRMIVAEAAFLLAAGVAAGAVCAAIAIAPAWLGRGGTMPGAGLVALLAAVVVSGLLSSLIASRAASSGRMLDALRAE